LIKNLERSESARCSRKGTSSKIIPEGTIGALLDAESRIGELLKPLTEHHEATSGAGSSSLPEGITHKQSHYFQQLAEHPDITEGVDSAVVAFTIMAGPRATSAATRQGQGRVLNCLRQPENVEPLADSAFSTRLGASGRPESQKYPCRCIGGRTFSILDRENVSGKRFSGVFSGNAGKSNGRFSNALEIVGQRPSFINILAFW